MERIDGDQEAVPEPPPPGQQVAPLGLLSLSEDENLPPRSVLSRPAGRPGGALCQRAPAASNSTAATNSWCDRIGVAPYRPSR